MNSAIDPLLAPITSLPGIGAAMAARLGRLLPGSPRVIDLLFHLPDSWIDRSSRSLLRDVLPGTIATVAVRVARHEAPASARQPWRVVVGDDSGFAELTFFARAGATPPALAALAPGAEVVVSGRADSYQGRISFAHPDHVLPRPAGRMRCRRSSPCGG